MMSIKQLYQVAEEVICAAEQRFIQGIGARPERIKGPGDFATAADLDIEAMVRSELSSRTGIPVLGEEEGLDSHQRSQSLWVVDPIDGTANYSTGNPSCAILLSLLKDGQPQLAFTSLPLIGYRLSAIRGEGLQTAGVPHRIIDVAPGTPTQVGFSSVGSQRGSSIPSPLRRGLLAELTKTPLRPRITGSVGVDLAFAALGVFGVAVSFSPHVWDNAAGALLVSEAGGVVSDLRGNPWHPGAKGVVAGVSWAHEMVVGTISSVS